MKEDYFSAEGLGKGDVLSETLFDSIPIGQVGVGRGETRQPVAGQSGNTHLGFERSTLDRFDVRRRKAVEGTARSFGSLNAKFQAVKSKRGQAGHVCPKDGNWVRVR